MPPYPVLDEKSNNSRRVWCDTKDIVERLMWMARSAGGSGSTRGSGLNCCDQDGLSLLGVFKTFFDNSLWLKRFKDVMYRDSRVYSCCLHLDATRIANLIVSCQYVGHHRHISVKVGIVWQV